MGDRLELAQSAIRHSFHSVSKDAVDTAKIFQSLPKQVVTAIHIDPTSYLTTIEKFLSGQFLFIYLLAGSIFAFVQGIGVIGKKIENGSIAGLLTKPLPRGAIYLAQFKVNAVMLALASFLLGGMSWVIYSAMLERGATISSDYVLWLFAGSGLVFITFAAVGQLVGTLLSGGKALQIGGGFVVVSYLLSSLGELAGLPEWLQRLSIFYYFNVTQLRDHFTLDWQRAVWLLLITLVAVVAGWLVFRRKDIYV